MIYYKSEELYVTNEYDPVLHNIQDKYYSNMKPIKASGIEILFTGIIFSVKLKVKTSINSIESIIGELYSKYSIEEIIKHIDGYYSIVIIDKGKLIVLSDKYGIETCYYLNDNNKFIYSTSLPLINKHCGLEINASIVPYYLLFSSLPSGYTFFNYLKKLKRAEYFIYSKDSFTINQYDYYNNLINGIANNYSENEVSKEIHYLLSKNIENITTDSEINIYNQLSGGIDSSLIQTVLLQFNSNDSYCNNIYGYGEDEKYSNDVAKHFNCNHTVYNYSIQELKVCIDEGIQNTLLPSVRIGEGMLNGSFKKISKKGPSISLSGSAADALWGHGKYLKIFKMFEIDLFGMRSLYPYISKLHNELAVLKYIDRENQDYNNLLTEKVFADEKVSNIINDEIKLSSIEIKTNNINRYSGYILDKLLHSQVFDGEVNWLNPLIYKLAKSHNSYVYYPFMSDDVTKYMLSIPINYKLKRYENKYYAKKYMVKYLPKKYVYRNKIGKNPPWELIFKNSMNKESMSNLDKILGDYLTIDSINKIYNDDNELLSIKLRNISSLINGIIK